MLELIFPNATAQQIERRKRIIVLTLLTFAALC